MKMPITGEQYELLKKTGLRHCLYKEERFFIDVPKDLDAVSYINNRAEEAKSSRRVVMSSLANVRLSADWTKKKSALRMSASKKNADRVAIVMGINSSGVSTANYMARGELAEKLNTKFGIGKAVCSGIVSAMIKAGVLEVVSA